MPDTERKPTVVLVHGAWADTSSWNGVIAAVTERGYEARAIANPLVDLDVDAASVRGFLVAVDGPVVLVGHSYGGSVITNAAKDTPNVTALVYVDAIAPDEGESNIALIGDDSALNQQPDDRLYDHAAAPGAPDGVTDIYLKKDVFVQSFGSDLPLEAAERLWATQRAVSTAAFATPTAHAAWKSIPTWFFVSSGDRIITSAAKTSMANRAGARVVSFDGGSHLSLISHPDAVAAAIIDAAETAS